MLLVKKRKVVLNRSKFKEKKTVNKCLKKSRRKRLRKRKKRKKREREKKKTFDLILYNVYLDFLFLQQDSVLFL